jgi:hypothetical protein
MNHRPLWGLSQDSNSLQLFTPNSFLRVDVPHAEIITDDPDGHTSKEALKALYEAQHRRIEYLWHEFHAGYLSELRKFAKATKKRFSLQPLKVGDIVLYEAVGEKARNFWPVARVSKLIMGNDGNPRAAEIEKYAPNEINTELRLKKYGKKKQLSPMERRVVTGWFKPMPRSYPITKLAPYEFWYNATVPTAVTDDDDVGKLPAHVKPTVRCRRRIPNNDAIGVLPIPAPITTRRQRGITKPIMVSYHLQSDDCDTSKIPRKCKGGNVRITLRSKVKDDMNISIPVTTYDDLEPVDKVATKTSRCYSDLVAFCSKSSYFMARVMFIATTE